MKKTIISMAIAIAVGTFFACGNQNKPQAEETAEAQNDTIFAPSDSVYHESFLRYAKEQCGLDLNLDQNVWLPMEFKSLDVENAAQASYYTKDDVDLEAMLDDFLGQCLSVSLDQSIGYDPKYKSVAEGKKHLVEKQLKNENDPSEGYSYIGKVTYAADRGRVTANITFTKAIGTTHVFYKLAIVPWSETRDKQGE